MVAPTLNADGSNKAQLTGDLTLATVTPLARRGRCLISAAEDVWQVDMAGVDQVSSAAVALLLDWYRYCEQREVRLEIANVPDRLQPIIAISDLQPVFTKLFIV
ncbi:hypothetical protein GCM10011297_33360 [Bacterioplanes sanyensis]|jgi:phospholipid transport system transporter-binding protein|uniref:STAS domain-containing protein n=1 Tax=Bacterioplanes sanyensis TaxID=1249553 RepID=UPI0016794380|nr:STAS domain-containing protein [Bacterioplanes sanyensis]GGY58008.1 hypothetical protein GCM10011297_33360 [Bacterioplanes sanyensis]